MPHLDLTTIPQAARQLGIGRNFARRIAIKAGIAVDFGGSERHKYLRVNVEELAAAVRAEKYRPAKAQPGTRRVRRGQGEMDPAVRC